MEFVEFWTICGANGIIIGEKERDRLKRYINELKYWNSKVNLISRRDEENILVRHILHSLSSLKYIDIPARANCLDVGTGGGLPGIPLAILNPEARMALVDSVAKKMKITDMLAKHTGLKHINSICGRAEELAGSRPHRNRYDFIFARALKRLDIVIGWVGGLMKPKGKLVLYKGGNLKEEISEAQAAFPKLIVKEVPISIVGVDWFESEEKKLLICEFTK